MRGSRISDQDLRSPPHPRASEENQSQDPASAHRAPPLHGRDLSNRAQILIRSSTPLPPWFGDFFQRLPEGPVSTDLGPQPPQMPSQSSASNRRSSSPPSDLCFQPSASSAKLGEEGSSAYIMELTDEEEEFDEFAALFSFPSLAAVSSPHSTIAVAEAWRLKELQREQELRSIALLKTEARAECQDCKSRTVKVHFRPVNRYSQCVLWPCDPEEDENFGSDDEF